MTISTSRTFGGDPFKMGFNVFKVKTLPADEDHTSLPAILRPERTRFIIEGVGDTPEVGLLLEALKAYPALLNLLAKPTATDLQTVLKFQKRLDENLLPLEWLDKPAQIKHELEELRKVQAWLKVFMALPPDGIEKLTAAMKDPERFALLVKTFFDLEAFYDDVKLETKRRLGWLRGKKPQESPTVMPKIEQEEGRWDGPQ